MSDPIAKRRPEESAVGREAAEMTARLYRITNTAPARLCSLALGVCLFAFIILPASAAAIPSEHPFEIIPGSFPHHSLHLPGGRPREPRHHLRLRPQRRRSRPTTRLGPPLSTFPASSAITPRCRPAPMPNSSAAWGTPIAFRNPMSPDTQVGQISFDFTFFSEVEHWTLPVYNMETDTGVTATLGFKALILTRFCRSRCGPRIPASPLPVPASTTWAKSTMFQSTSGRPRAASHNAERGEECDAFGGCHNGARKLKFRSTPFSPIRPAATDR